MTQGTEDASAGGQAQLTALVVEDSPPMRKMIVALGFAMTAWFTWKVLA